MLRLRRLIATLILMCAGLSHATAQETPKPETKPTVPAQYAASVFSQSDTSVYNGTGLDIYVDGSTSDGEAQELIGILKQKGQDGLVNALEDMKDKGRVAPNGSVGTGVRVVRIRPNKNGGEHIVPATDRPISFGELRNGTRSRDYPIGIVVLDVDRNGKGTGLFALACKVKFDKKGELVVEHYGQPARQRLPTRLKPRGQRHRSQF